ncbi:DUF4148 domain-containing protein [Caballeronia insecticola]|uniref:Uncharacterized protein n=1 Tax=Caballeronia insecticola TaxID=758793 RepID=R4WY43_9BURK|nr:DUF4148 domain-containing protein [Caballeronia insecticola]BAN26255.1 putative uncharacterized protein [Caballeronia insecticola]
MIRFSDRSFVVGLCVVAVSIAASSYLLKHGRHHADQSVWSSRQRASVAMGVVREAAPATSNDRTEVSEVPIVDAPAENHVTIATPANRARDFKAAEAHPPHVAARVKKTNGVKRPADVAQQHQDDVPNVSAPVHEASPVAAPAPSIAAPSTAQVASPHLDEPVVTSAPRPKTRKDVEEELRQARMNGSLPRFGNPDPYGPGGSPSASNK